MAAKSFVSPLAVIVTSPFDDNVPVKCLLTEKFVSVNSRISSSF